MIAQDNKKHLINLRLEESKVLETIEKLRQLILTSSLPQNRVLRLNDTLDAMHYNISCYYEEKVLSSSEIGNI